MSRTSRHAEDIENSQYAGKLSVLNTNGVLTKNCREISFGRDIFIGRNRSTCDWAFEDDPYMSNKHLRIFTSKCDIPGLQTQLLVYAEDLSRHGSFWNDSLLKWNGVVVLSDNDHLRLTSQTTLRFIAGTSEADHFDMVQEREMQTFSDQFVLTDRIVDSKCPTRTFVAVKRTTHAHMACQVVNLADMDDDEYCTLQVTSCSSTKRSRNTSIDAEERGPATKKRGLRYGVASYVHAAQITKLLKHPNVLNIEKLLASDHSLYIFQQLSTHNNLFTFLKDHQWTLLETEVGVILFQLFQAVKFLHMEHTIAHCNIRPENVLLSRLWTGDMVVLSGFEQAIAAKSTYWRPRMIPNQYSAPELIDEHMKDSSVKSLQQGDMWSLGAVSVAIVTGDVAASGDTFDDHHQLARFWSHRVTALTPVWTQQPCERWEPVKDFCSSLLETVPQQRPNVEQHLHHRWFTRVSSAEALKGTYSKLVQHWSPSTLNTTVVELISGKSTKIRLLPCIERVVGLPKHRHGPPRRPVEPPYKPFPRKMHLRGLWPARTTEMGQMSEEVEAAIREYWSKSRSSQRCVRTDPLNHKEEDHKMGQFPESLSTHHPMLLSIMPQLKRSNICISDRASTDQFVVTAKDLSLDGRHSDVSTDSTYTADTTLSPGVRPKASLRRRSERRQPLAPKANQGRSSVFEIPVKHEFDEFSEIHTD